MARPSISLAIARFTIAIIASCNRKRSRSNSSSVVVGATRCRRESHVHFRKRPGKKKSIPTLQSPAARKFDVNRHDPRTRFLREENDAGLHMIDRTARTVGRNANVAAGCENFGQLQDRARTYARARTAHGLETEGVTASASKAPSRLGLTRTVCARHKRRTTGAIRKSRLCQSAPM